MNSQEVRALFHTTSVNTLSPLLDAGRSLRGWSRIGTMASCAQRFAYQEILGIPMVSAEALTCGSMGHILQAHDLAIQGAADGGVTVNGVWLTDPTLLLQPIPAMEEWAAKNGGTRYVGAMADMWRRYRAGSSNQHGRVLAVEQEVVSVVAQDDADPAGRLAVAWRYDMTSADPRDWTFWDRDGNELVLHRLTNSEPIVLTRRWDAAIQEYDGLCYVWDHKHTAAQVKPERAASAYAVDGGFVALTIQGQDVFGPLYGGTRLNIVQRRSPFIVARPLIGGHNHMIEQFPETLRDLEQRRLDLSSRDPWRYPKAASESGACDSVYGQCPAMDLCLHGKIALSWRG